MAALLKGCYLAVSGNLEQVRIGHHSGWLSTPLKGHLWCWINTGANFSSSISSITTQLGLSSRVPSEVWWSFRIALHVLPQPHVKKNGISDRVYLCRGGQLPSQEAEESLVDGGSLSSRGSADMSEEMLFWALKAPRS